MKKIKDQIYNYHDYQSRIQDFLRFFSPSDLQVGSP